MTEVFEHNPGDHEDPIAGPTWTVGIVGTALFAVSVLGTAALFYDFRGVEDEQKLTITEQAEASRWQRDALVAEQRARLHAPVHIERRADAEDGALVIPIDHAMQFIVNEAAESN